MKKIKTEVKTEIPEMPSFMAAENEPEITIKLSEYSELQKQNFIANVVMQYLYNNCELNYDDTKLRFSTSGLDDVMEAVDKPNYDNCELNYTVLAMKQEEKRERENEREENRSEEE